MPFDLKKVLNTEKYYTYEKGILLYKGDPIINSKRNREENEISFLIPKSCINTRYLSKHKNINQVDINLICFSYSCHKKLYEDMNSISKKLYKKNITTKEDSIFL